MVDDRHASSQRERVRSSARCRLIAVWALALVAACVSGCSDTPDKFEPLRFVLITDDPAQDLNPSFSPDGKYVAMTRKEGLSRDIWVKSLDGAMSRRLTTDPRTDDSPAWSPDGKWIAYSRTIPSECPEILIQPAAGGEERRVAFGIRPTWNASSTKLIFELCHLDVTSTYGLAYVDLSDTLTHPAVVPDGVFSDPEWAHHSERIAVRRQVDVGEFPETDIWVISSSGSQATQLTYLGNASSPAWSPDDKFMACAGRDSLFILRLSDGAFRSVDTSSIPGRVRVGAPAWSRDGTSIAATVSHDSQADILLIENIPTFLSEF